MDTDEEMLVWAIMLCFTRGVYQRRISMYDRQVLDLNDQAAFFLIELVLGGNYEEELIEKVYAIPYALQEEIKGDYRN